MHAEIRNEHNENKAISLKLIARIGYLITESRKILIGKVSYH